MRSRILWFAFLVLSLSLLPVRSSAQGCAGVMTPEYSSYLTISGDSSNHIYTSAGVDGYTAIGNTEYCNISGTTHRASVCNTLGGVGGCSTSGAVSPASYLGWSQSEEIVGVPGVNYLDSVSASVICSAVGTIYSAGGSLSKYIEWAVTTEKKNGAGTYYPNQNVWEYPAVPWCNNGTPDLSDTPILDDSANAAIDVYWVEQALMIRLSTTSTWTRVGYTATTSEYTTIPNPANFACTHTGPQQ